jgi:D-lactate dehydrogenase
MNIAFFEIDTWEQTFFDGMQSVHSVQFVQGHLGVDSAPEFENAEIISVFIYSQLTRAVLEQLPRLRMIATRAMYRHMAKIPSPSMYSLCSCA